jgi:hypothetical protein
MTEKRDDGGGWGRCGLFMWEKRRSRANPDRMKLNRKRQRTETYTNYGVIYREKAGNIRAKSLRCMFFLEL